MNGMARLNLVTVSGASVHGLPAVPLRPTRLTRRGRAALLSTLVGAAVVGGLTMGQNPSVASGETPAPQSYEYVVAQPGDTLWQIARRAAPTVDPRSTIDRIRDLNALSGVDIRAGQRIALP